MKIKIAEATRLSNEILAGLGFPTEEARYCTSVFLDGELTNKKSHGLMRLIRLATMIQDGRVKVSKASIKIVRETPSSILLDGRGKTGFYVVPKTLELAIKKLKGSKIGMVCAGCMNTAPAAGMIGYYARKAAEKNLIYIGFHNSMSYLIPFGSNKALWGTNPITIGVPTNDIPVIWDCSAGKMSVGEMALAKEHGKKLPKNIAFDKDGNPTTDPVKALEGGILPFSDKKGSGMAFIVELLAGALTGSSIRPDKQWHWGAFFVLIDPNIIRPIAEFKKDISESIKLHKNSPKIKGVKEIYFPGERSQKKMKTAILNGTFDIDNQLLIKLEHFAK